MDLFPEGWLDGGLDKKRLAKLSKHVVDNDRWDREDVRNMLKELPPFSAARKQLGEFAPTGEETRSGRCTRPNLSCCRPTRSIPTISSTGGSLR
jgi:hypothetical protein